MRGKNDNDCRTFQAGKLIDYQITLNAKLEEQIRPNARFLLVQEIKLTM